MWNPLFLQIVLSIALGTTLLNTGHFLIPTPQDTVGRKVPELALITRGGEITKLSSLHGKWVLLEFGSTWFPDSEATALLGSNIRESLDGYPFEFVQIFDDPSACDGEMFSMTQFAGVRAVIAPPAFFSFFSKWRHATWFLLDPQGVVRAAGRASSPESLRQSLGRAWAADPSMANAPLAPSRIQALGEKMLQIYDDANPQPMADLAETILQSDPTNELALRFLLHSLVRTKGYASANKLLAQKTSGMSLLDGTKIYMTSCRLAESDRTGIRDELRAWCEKYPESRYLRCLNLLTQKLPGELTPDEKGLLKSAWRQPRAWNIKLYSGFVEQWDGHPEKAQKNFEEERGRGIVGQLALADNLKRLGHTDEADSLVKHRHLNPEKTNPTEAWEQMLACTVLLDLVEASKFAHAYQKLRPEKAQGYLIGWLAARLSGNDSQAHELRSSSLELMQGSERYLVAKQLLEAQKLPSVTDLTNIEDISIRFDTALLFVMLDWEDKPLPLPSLKTAQLAFWPGNWPYDILNKLRSVISQPAAVAKVDAEGNSEKAKE